MTNGSFVEKQQHWIGLLDGIDQNAEALCDQLAAAGAFHKRGDKCIN